MNDVGFVNSIETLGALDGPGIRTVIFFQGCGLKCKYCHNPECIDIEKGNVLSIDQLFDLVIKNKPYLGNYKVGSEIKGGVTFSGGEPTFQTDFIHLLSKKLKAENIHLTVDTSLFTSSKNIEKLLPYIDYWMVSLKHMDPAIHKDLTGFENNIILKNLKFLDSKISDQNLASKIRIRFLLLPGYTDTKENIEQMIKFVKTIKNIDCIEILGYGSHAKDKWIKLYGHYDLSNVPDATIDKIEVISKIFQENKFQVIY